MSTTFTQECLAIGGIGGSGTRAFADVFRTLGFDIGFDLNDSLDDLTFTVLFKDRALWPLERNTELFKRRLAAFLALRNPKYAQPLTEPEVTDFCKILPDANNGYRWLQAHFLEQRVSAVRKHSGTQSAQVIWKEPNTHIFLPALLALLPNFRYLHVVRNGLDMAWSKNQNQLALWGEELLQRPVSATSAQDSFDYWCIAHQRLLQIQSTQPERVLIMGLEQAANAPGDAAQRIKDLIGTMTSTRSTDSIKGAIESVVQLPKGVNRYKSQPSLNPKSAQQAILRELGYATDDIA